MVSEGILPLPSSHTTSEDDGKLHQNVADEPDDDDEDDKDSNASSSQDDQDLDCDGQIILRDDAQQDQPSFGNISVMNSNDVHFGNKTFYQGPVTIKQFLYANGQKQIDCGDQSSVVVDSSAINSEIVLDAATISKDFVSDLTNGFATTEFKSFKSPKSAAPETTHSGIWKGYHWFKKIAHENFVVLISLLALLMISLTILMVVLLVKHPVVVDDDDKNPYIIKADTDEQDKNSPVASPLDPNVNLTLSGKLKLVSRFEWVAQPPVQQATPLTTPVPYVIIMHTATENCSFQAECVFHVRYIQTFHIESKNWWDIGYNFLVGGDGEAYEGRGWKSEGAHTFGYNSRSIGIAFVGTFQLFRPPERQLRACKQLIAKGVELGYISKNYKLLGARQLYSTQSPGNFLYEEIKTWDHWAKEP